MALIAFLTIAALVGGCGTAAGPAPPRAPAVGGEIPASLVRESRPIGRGPRFHPPARGPVPGPCRPALGRRSGVHVELFASDRVVLVAAGIGARAPLRHVQGRISGAACYGSLVTLEPTGVVLVTPGAPLRLAELFRAWGQPLSSRRLGPFAAPRGSPVSVFVNGRRRPGPPGRVRLTTHAEIVLEVGPPVPPHSRYEFPPGA